MCGIFFFLFFLVLSSPPHQLKKKSLEFSVNGGRIGKAIAMWVGELLQNEDTQGRGVRVALCIPRSPVRTEGLLSRPRMESLVLILVAPD